MDKIVDLRNRLEQRKGQRAQLLDTMGEVKSRIRQTTRRLRNAEDAQTIVQAVAEQTQKELEYRISELATLALASVFDVPYSLNLDFVPKRGKTEAEIYYEKGGEQMDPMAESGGGPIDIGAFALRPTLWSLARPRSRNLLVLDEPFAHLKGMTTNQKALNLVKEVSEKLKIQVLMVSDERVPRQMIVDSADKMFETVMKKGITEVKEVKGEE